MENKNILVERDTYEKNGKTFFTYFVKGTLRGKEVKASVMPMDIGGYAVLDIVFNGANQASLVVKPFELKDEKTGACGSVLNLLDYKFNHKIEIEKYILKDECEKILKDFFKELRKLRK